MHKLKVMYIKFDVLKVKKLKAIALRCDTSKAIYHGHL